MPQMKEQVIMLILLAALCEKKKNKQITWVLCFYQQMKTRSIRQGNQYSQKFHPYVYVTCRAITVVTCSSRDVYCIALFFKLIFADHWPLFVQWIFVQHCHVLCKTRYHSIWELIWYHWRQLLLFKPCPCMLSTTKKRSPYHQIFASFSRWSHKAMHPWHSRCVIKALFLATTIISNRQNFIRGVAIYSRTEESIWAGALSNM